MALVPGSFPPLLLPHLESLAADADAGKTNNIKQYNLAMQTYEPWPGASMQPLDPEAMDLIEDLLEVGMVEEAESEGAQREEFLAGGALAGGVDVGGRPGVVSALLAWPKTALYDAKALWRSVASFCKTSGHDEPEP